MIRLKYEKSCGAIVYRILNDEILYLIIKNVSCVHWGYPKGHSIPGEDDETTAIREIYEETGLNVNINKYFKKTVVYYPKPDITKEVVYFIAYSKNGTVSIQKDEVSEYKWCKFDIAYNLITFDSNKQVLMEANAYILNELLM